MIYQKLVEYSKAWAPKICPNITSKYNIYTYFVQTGPVYIIYLGQQKQWNCDILSKLQIYLKWPTHLLQVTHDITSDFPSHGEKKLVLHKNYNGA